MRRRRSTRARDKTSRDMNEVDTGDGWEKGIAMTSKAHWATAEKVDLPPSSKAPLVTTSSSASTSSDENRIPIPQHETEAAASYILQNAQNHSRTIISHNPLPEMTTGEFIARANEVVSSQRAEEDGFEDEMQCCGSWYHFEGRVPDITLRCVEYLRSAQAGQEKEKKRRKGEVKVSVECEKPERERLSDVARLADVVFYSRLWANVCSMLSYGKRSCLTRG